MDVRYRIRYFFDDPASTCLWSGNDRARNAFGYPIDYHLLPLSQKTTAETERMVCWYSRSANAQPGEPGPWRQEECNLFNQGARALLSAIRCELRDSFEVIDEYKDLREHPNLDAYLADPDEYRQQHRKHYRHACDRTPEHL